MSTFISATEVRNKLLDFMCGTTNNSQWTLGSAYLGLSTTTPSYDSNGNITGITEPSGNGYERKCIGITTQSATQLMKSASLGVAKNEEIHFNQATGAWGTITHWALYTSESATTPIAAGSLTASVSVTTDRVVIIHEDDMSITFSAS